MEERELDIITLNGEQYVNLLQVERIFWETYATDGSGDQEEVLHDLWEIFYDEIEYPPNPFDDDCDCEYCRLRLYDED